MLSSDDPIRVFQRFSTLDAASNGRAEVILGRGSFTESFPLFGYELSDYETLFEEKLDLFTALLKQEPVSWQGSTRSPLRDQRVFPPIEGERRLKTWIGVGGSPESVIRAARYDLPLALAIIGGDPKRFRPYVDLYHRAFEQLGRPVQPISVHSPGYVADTDIQAREELFTDYKRMRDKIGAERGWPPMGQGEFEREAEHGSLYVGSPETVARKIAATVSRARRRALPAEIQRRAAAARQADAQHRAFRQQGHAARPRDAGLTLPFRADPGEAPAARTWSAARKPDSRLPSIVAGSPVAVQSPASQRLG